MTNEGDMGPGRDTPADDGVPDGRVAATPRAGPGPVAWLALLTALAAMAGVGLLYWQMNLAPQPVDPRFAALERRLTEFGQRPGTVGASEVAAVRAEIEQVATELRAVIDAQKADGDTAAGPAATLAPSGDAPAAASTPRDWQLAEARYLLRMANHRVLLERDATGAVALLRAADDVLVALDDFALHDVRARIADEVLALESLPAVDAEGLFLQIEAIKRDVDRLPLRIPELLPAAPAAVEPAGIWAALRAELGELMRFRRFEGTVRPLLAPQEAVYLELNLRLMLERAQLAGLRHEQAVYAQSIATAREWIENYLDVRTPEVHRVLDGLRALEGVDLAAPLPDTSGSLNALNAALGSMP